MAYSTFSHVEITALSCVVPPKVISFDEEREFYPTERLFLRNKQILGLGTRHVVENGLTVSDLGEAAVKSLVKAGVVDLNEVESLIFSTVTGDYPYPGCACVLHGRLGLKPEVMCFDLAGLSCSAYVHALLQASALIESGAVQNCLLLCGDIASTDTDRRNHLTNILFGDAVVATYLRRTEKERPSFYLTGTDGTRFDSIIAPAGGKAFPIRKDIADVEIVDERGNVWHPWEDIIDGMGVFEFTVTTGPAFMKELLTRSQLTFEDVDFVAVHQANGQIVKMVCQQAGVPKDKWSAETFRNYGNCASASVASVVCDQCQGMGRVMLCSFGLGLSAGAAIVDLSGAQNLGISVMAEVPDKMSREELTRYWCERFLKAEVKH